MKIKTLLIFIVLSKFSFCQSAIIKEIKQKNPLSGELYVFPNIILIKSDIVELKINNLLRSDILYIDTITAENKIFDQVWRVTDRSEIVSDIAYKIKYNSGYILSLSITAQGCGAYCETGTDYFTFNLHTGNKITLDSLFSKDGIQTLADSLNLSKTKKLNAEIRNIRNKLKSKKIETDKEEKELCTEMLELYTDCLTTKIDPEYVGDMKFVFKGESLSIYSDRCSAHHNMAIDELWIFEYKVNLSRWAKYLSPFGRKVISK